MMFDLWSFLAGLSFGLMFWIFFGRVVERWMGWR